MYKQSTLSVRQINIVWKVCVFGEDFCFGLAVFYSFAVVDHVRKIFLFFNVTLVDGRCCFHESFSLSNFSPCLLLRECQLLSAVLLFVCLLGV